MSFYDEQQEEIENLKGRVKMLELSVSEWRDACNRARADLSRIPTFYNGTARRQANDATDLLKRTRDELQFIFDFVEVLEEKDSDWNCRIALAKRAIKTSWEQRNQIRKVRELLFSFPYI